MTHNTQTHRPCGEAQPTVSSSPRRSRRAYLALGAFVTLGSLAVPTLAAAAPVAPAAPVVATPLADGRVDDTAATQAALALTFLRQWTETGDESIRASYDSQRAAVAATIAGRLGIAPADLQQAWARADIQHQMALMAALTQLGVPYRRNTSKEGIGFDCSGLTTYAWAQAGVTLPRSSGSQIKSIAARTSDTAQAGDIIQYPGHVMIWLGVDRAMVHAPYTGRNVEVDVVSARRSLKYGNPIG